MEKEGQTMNHPETIEPKSPSEVNHLESELRMTLEENARLQNALADANMRILAMQNGQQHSTGITGAEVYRSLIRELEQPLTTINSFCDILLLESVGILGSLQRKFIERIQHASQSMHIMIDDLSRYAGRDLTSGSSPTESVNIVEICHAILNSLSDIFQEKQITLALDLDDTLPAVHADRQDIQEIIRYLLRNAVLAAPANGFVHLSVKLDPDMRNKAAIVTVFNSGKGIKEIDITRIFSSIVPDAGSKISGLGIDLKEFSILRMLVEEMDDSLNVISDPVDGTSFILKVPLRA
jgi:Signal transduction histidine kinase